jgi:hypothetical protein
MPWILPVCAWSCFPAEGPREERSSQTALFRQKETLKLILPAAPSRLMYVDHIAQQGEKLFDLVCERDLEGIVAKWADGLYLCDGHTTNWVKIKNRVYSQMEGTAMLDRLLHHGHVLKCGPRSWRTKTDLPPQQAAG